MKKIVIATLAVVLTSCGDPVVDGTADEMCAWLEEHPNAGKVVVERQFENVYMRYRRAREKKNPEVDVMYEDMMAGTGIWERCGDLVPPGTSLPPADFNPYVEEGLPSRLSHDEGYPDFQPDPACPRSVATVTIRFANTAGQVVPRAGKLVREDSAGCRVVVRVQDLPGASNPDVALYQAMQAIDEAVSPQGWEHRRGATWVNRRGFTVTAHLGREMYENEFDYTQTAYKVRLTGRRPTSSPPRSPLRAN
jgi:hypothetical protein